MLAFLYPFKNASFTTIIKEREKRSKFSLKAQWICRFFVKEEINKSSSLWINFQGKCSFLRYQKTSNYQSIVKNITAIIYTAYFVLLHNFSCQFDSIAIKTAHAFFISFFLVYHRRMCQDRSNIIQSRREMGKKGEISKNKSIHPKYQLDSSSLSSFSKKRI